MQTLFNVDACHPVAKRVIEYKLTEVEKNDLLAELTEAGYEDIEVRHHDYYEDGDEITITKEFVIANSEFVIANSEDEFFRMMTYIAEEKAKNQGIDMLDINKDAMFPLTGKIKALRMNRTFGHLIITWDIGESHDGCDRFKETNVYFLEKVGLRFIQPEFEAIPILNADDNLLYEDELVTKHYALQNELTIEDAQAVLDKVRSAMAVHGIVFYRP